MQTNPAVEQNENIKWSESPWNRFGTGSGGPVLCEEEIGV